MKCLLGKVNQYPVLPPPSSMHLASLLGMLPTSLEKYSAGTALASFPNAALNSANVLHPLASIFPCR